MKEKKRYYVYILASGKNGTIYVGVTGNLRKRISEHKEKIVKGFTEKYAVNQLVFYEIYKEIGQALYREKQLKNWRREWKVALIEKENPQWIDLFDGFLDSGSRPGMTQL